MQLIDSLLDDGNLRIEFQPIFSCGGDTPRLFAVEALARGKQGSHFEQPSVLFDYVRLKHAEVIADHRCVAAALREAALLPAAILLSINVHACTLERDVDFPKFVIETAAEYGIAADRLILEIVEQGRYWSRAKLLRALSELRAAGARFALDDVGAGTCNFGTILDTRPEYLKIDAHIVQGCSEDSYRRKILDSIRRLAVDFEARVIAEGIETRSDFETVIALGIDVAQGFLLGRPGPLSQICEIPRTLTSNQSVVISLS